MNLTISDFSADRVDTNRQLGRNFMERIRAEVSSLETVPTIEQVRAALVSIPGSLSNDVVSDRGEF